MLLLQSGFEVLGLAMTTPDLAVEEYAPSDPILSRIPCLATVVSDASQLSTLLARGAKATCGGAAITAWPRVSAQSAAQKGAMRKKM
jgi:hypothetical protein